MSCSERRYERLLAFGLKLGCFSPRRKLLRKFAAHCKRNAPTWWIGLSGGMGLDGPARRAPPELRASHSLPPLKALQRTHGLHADAEPVGEALVAGMPPARVELDC